MSPGVERIVTLTSQCESAIEIFSLDFNHTYLEEEEILGAISVYDSNGIYRTAVRNAGEGLPLSIISVYKLLSLIKN